MIYSLLNNFDLCLMDCPSVIPEIEYPVDDPELEVCKMFWRYLSTIILKKADARIEDLMIVYERSIEKYPKYSHSISMTMRYFTVVHGLDKKTADPE